MRARGEKTYPDVGGGFVEPHHRGDVIEWGDDYPYKGTETTIARGARGLLGAGGELNRSELGGSSGAARGLVGARAGHELQPKTARFTR